MSKILTGIFSLAVFLLTLYFKDEIIRWDGGLLSASLLLFCFLVLSLVLHLFLHEGGHLVAGLCSGYKFSSFRVFRVQLVSRDGKLQLKRFHIPGTGGQCLMAPPTPFSPEFKVVPYNLGGGLGNALPALALWGIYGVLPGKDPLLGLFVAAFCLAGFVTAAMNLVPRQVGGIANDGWNMRYLWNNKEARFDLWLMLEINHRLTQGERISQMPKEWFDREPQEGEPLDNAMTSAGAIYRFAMLLDAHRFPEALETAKRLLQPEYKLIELYRMELLCECAFLALLLGQEEEWAMTRIASGPLRKYRRATAGYPARKRLDYAVAKLWDKDEKGAVQALLGFEKVCRSYPYEGDIAAERELLEQVTRKAAALDPKKESQ